VPSGLCLHCRYCTVSIGNLLYRIFASSGRPELIGGCLPGYLQDFVHQDEVVAETFKLQTNQETTYSDLEQPGQTYRDSGWSYQAASLPAPGSKYIQTRMCQGPNPPEPGSTQTWRSQGQNPPSLDLLGPGAIRARTHQNLELLRPRSMGPTPPAPRTVQA
jgi:hypothetical protein